MNDEPLTPPPLMNRTATAPSGCGFAHTCCAPFPAGASDAFRKLVQFASVFRFVWSCLKYTYRITTMHPVFTSKVQCLRLCSTSQAIRAQPCAPKDVGLNTSQSCNFLTFFSSVQRRACCYAALQACVRRAALTCPHLLPFQPGAKPDSFPPHCAAAPEGPSRSTVHARNSDDEIIS